MHCTLLAGIVHQHQSKRMGAGREERMMEKRKGPIETYSDCRCYACKPDRYGVRLLHFTCIYCNASTYYEQHRIPAHGVTCNHCDSKMFATGHEGRGYVVETAS